MKRVFALLLALTFGLLTACGSAQQTVKPSDTDKRTENAETAETAPEVEKPNDLTSGIKVAPVAQRRADGTFEDSQMRFCVALFKAAATQKGENILLSPLSVSLALAMTLNGTDNATKTQMEDLLCGGFGTKELNEYLHTYMDSLPSEKTAKLVPANSVWVNDSGRIEVREAFLQAVKDYYSSEVFKEKFGADTVRKVNSWIEDKTEGMIKKTLDELDPEVVMLLINALTFDAEWSVPYKEYQVREREFTNADGSKKTVDFMYSGENTYLSDGNAEGFMKYYKGGRFAFAAMLPKEGMSVEDYISTLTADGLSETLKNAQSASISTATPKFKSDYSVSLKETLELLGMTDAFEPGIADFRPMADSADPLYIGGVLHKTYIEVDERGTKAGAVTVVEVDATSAEPTKPREIFLDRPFVYMIVDTETSLPVFIGALTNME